MSRLPSPHDPQAAFERLHQLLADRALFGLDDAEQTELQHLLHAHPEVEADSFDLAAAALDLALTPAGDEPLPDHLRRRVSETLGSNASPSKQQTTVSPASRGSAREWLGWLAAAACLALAVSLWNANRDTAPVPLAEQRQRLIDVGGATTRLDWTATADPTADGASGDVVWNNAAQQGYMRFRGLAVNDPKVEQYQLWIFDAAQDERYPIDGGVFDVDPTTGEVIVPIRPAIRVVDPKMFAITVEKPGGVVVSSRERIALLAKGT